MGREIRRVPKDWEHPKRGNGEYQPMFDEGFEGAVQEWKLGLAQWDAGKRHEQAKDYEWWEWHGDPPDRDYYRPDWTDEERTHCQLYENVSEGTPLSPPMDSEESLAAWLNSNPGAAHLPDGEAIGYDGWLAFVRRGYAPSFVLGPCGLQSGIAAMAELKS